MKERQAMDRRSLLKAAGAAAGLAAVGVGTRATEAAEDCCKDKQACIHFKNEFFYDAQG